MEYQVNVNTTCARNSTFVKWQDGVSMFGVRFAKEDQAEQVFLVKRLETSKNLIVSYYILTIGYPVLESNQLHCSFTHKLKEHIQNIF